MLPWGLGVVVVMGWVGKAMGWEVMGPRLLV